MSDVIGTTPPAGWDLWSWVIDPAYGLSPVRPGVEALWKIYTVHAEVGNGGLWQVFFNLDQDFIDAAAVALQDIGAARHAELLARTAVVLGELPREGEARQLMVDQTDPEHLAALEDAWYEDEDLDQLVERYIRSHAAELLPPSA